MAKANRTSTMLDHDAPQDQAPPPSPPANPPPPDQAGPVVSPETPKPARQGSDDRPYCPRHLCTMRAQKSTETETVYACPVPGCDSREKKARPAMRVAAEPKHCPQRACEKNEGSYLAVDPKRSTAAQVELVCPTCGYHVKQPRPEFREFAARDQRRKEREATADDLAVR